MEVNKDFKTVTLTFNRDNKDIKDLLVKFMEQTGKSKVDIVADALRQYDPNKSFISSLNKEDVRALMKEILLEEGILPNEVEELEYENLNDLNDKKIDNRFLNDDD